MYILRTKVWEGVLFLRELGTRRELEGGTGGEGS